MMLGEPSWVVGLVGEHAGLAGLDCWRNHHVIFCLAPILLPGTTTFLLFFVSREGHITGFSWQIELCSRAPTGMSGLLEL